MNLHEYQAKELFREYGIAVSEGLSASSSEEVIDKAKSLNVDTKFFTNSNEIL